MKLIGYWPDPESPAPEDYPDPSMLVDPNWLSQEKALLVAYLRADYAIRGSWGYSWCRFQCGIHDSAMGSMDYSDGVWIWPHGLPHYVECHGIVLPDEFVNHARSQNWVCPSVRMGSQAPGRLHVDKTFWIEWSKTYIKKRKQEA